MLRQIVSPLSRPLARIQQTGQVVRQYHPPSNHRTTTMDDLPVPCGSWDVHNKNKQSKYNLHLLLGIVFTGVTLLTAKMSGLVYLNSSPPSLD